MNNGPSSGPSYGDFRGDRMDRSSGDRPRNYDSAPRSMDNSRSDQRYEARTDYGTRDGRDSRNLSSTSDRGSDRGSAPSDRPYYGRDGPQRDSRDVRDVRDHDSSMPRHSRDPGPVADYRDQPSRNGPYGDPRDARDSRDRDVRDFRGDARGSGERIDRDRDGGRDGFRDAPPPSASGSLHRSGPSGSYPPSSRYDGPPNNGRRDEPFDGSERPDLNGAPYSSSAPPPHHHSGPANPNDGMRRSHGDSGGDNRNRDFGRPPMRSNDRDSPHDRDGALRDRDREGDRANLASSGGNMPPIDSRRPRPSGPPPMPDNRDSPLRMARPDPSGGRPPLEHRHRPSIMGPSHRPSITAPMRQFDSPARQFDAPARRSEHYRQGNYGEGGNRDYDFRPSSSSSSPPRYSNNRPSIMQGSSSSSGRTPLRGDYGDREYRDRDGPSYRDSQKRSSDYSGSSNALNATSTSQQSSSSDIKKEGISPSETPRMVTEASSGDANNASSGTLSSSDPNIGVASESGTAGDASVAEQPRGPTQAEVLAGIEIKEDEIVEVSKELENLMKEREKLMKEVSTSENAKNKGKISNLVHGLPIRPEWLSFSSVEVIKATYEQNLRLSLRSDAALTAQLVDASLRSKYAPFLNYLKTTSKQFRYQSIHAAIIKNFVTSTNSSSARVSPSPTSIAGSQEASSLNSSSTTNARDSTTEDSKMQISSDPATSSSIVSPQPSPALSSNAMQVDAPVTHSSTPATIGNEEDVVVIDADYLPDIFKKIRERVLAEDDSKPDDSEQDVVEICEEATAILENIDNPDFFEAVPSPSIDQLDYYKTNLEQHDTWRDAMVKVLMEKKREIAARALRASKELKKSNLLWYRQLQMEKEEEASRRLLQNKKWLHVAQSGRKFSVRSAALTSSGGAASGTSTETNSNGGGRSMTSMMSGSSGVASTSTTPAKKRWLSTSVGGEDSDDEEEDEERFEATRAEVPTMLIFDEDADNHRRDMIDHTGAVEDSRFVDLELKVARPWHPEEEDVFVRAFMRFHKDFVKIASYLPTKELAEVIWFYYTRKFKLDLKRRYQREGVNQLQLMTLGLSALQSSDPAAATLAHYMGSTVEWVNGNTRRGSLRLLEKGSGPSGGGGGGGGGGAPGAPSGGSVGAAPNASGKPGAAASYDRSYDRSDPAYVPTSSTGRGGYGSANSGSGRDKMSLLASSSSHGQTEDENVDIERSLAASGGITGEGTYSPGRGAGIETQNRWTPEEREKFKAAFDVHYKDFKAISEIMRTKNAAQCKNYYHNNKKKLGLPSVARVSVDTALKQSPPSSPATSSRTADSSELKTEASVGEVENGSAASSLRASANLSASTSIRLSSDAVEASNTEVKAEPKAAPAEPSVKKTVARVNTSHWTDDEKAKFKELLQIHGKDWKSLAGGINSKTVAQIKNFFQNYRLKLKLDDLLPEADRNNANARGGRGKKRKVKPRGRPKRTAAAGDADEDGNASDWMDEDESGVSGDETEGEEGEIVDRSEKTDLRSSDVAPSAPTDSADDHTSNAPAVATETANTDDMPPRAAGKDAKRKRDGDASYDDENAATTPDDATDATNTANTEEDARDKMDMDDGQSVTSETADDASNTSLTASGSSKRGKGAPTRGGRSGGRGGKGNGSKAPSPTTAATTATPPPTKKRKEGEDGEEDKLGVIEPTSSTEHTEMAPTPATETSAVETPAATTTD